MTTHSACLTHALLTECCAHTQGLALRLPHVIEQMQAVDIVTAQDAFFRSGMHDSKLLAVLDSALVCEVDGLKCDAGPPFALHQ